MISLNINKKLINKEKYITEYNQIFFQYKNDTEIEDIDVTDFDKILNTFNESDILIKSIRE